MRSTVYGTKDFTPLDANVIAAIKGKLTESFTCTIMKNLHIKPGFKLPSIVSYIKSVDCI